MAQVSDSPRKTTHIPPLPKPNPVMKSIIRDILVVFLIISSAHIIITW